MRSSTKQDGTRKQTPHLTLTAATRARGHSPPHVTQVCHCPLHERMAAPEVRQRLRALLFKPGGNPTSDATPARPSCGGCSSHCGPWFWPVESRRIVSPRKIFLSPRIMETPSLTLRRWRRSCRQCRTRLLQLLPVTFTQRENGAERHSVPCVRKDLW